MTSEPKYTPSAIHPHPGIRLIFMSFNLAELKEIACAALCKRPFNLNHISFGKLRTLLMLIVDLQ